VKKKKMEQKRRSLRKDKKGFTGLEAAIVLTAFVVVAAVFSYVVLNAGFFTTEKAKEVVHTGVEQATSSLVLSGEVVAIEGTTTGTIDTIYIPLALSAGGNPVHVGADQDDHYLSVAYTDEGVYEDACTWSANWTEERSDNDRLDYGERIQITVTIPADSKLKTAADATDRAFTIELKPAIGAVLSVDKTTPSFIDEIMLLR
jgi:flagellin FlaB